MDAPLQSTTDQPAKRLGGATGKGFRPGRSGNPLGVSRDQHSMATQIRKAGAEITPEALLFLRDAWRNPKVRWSDRIAAARAVLATGHANALKDASPMEGLQIVVERLVVGDAKPVPGVICSPIAAHVCLPSTTPYVDVVDVDA